MDFFPALHDVLLACTVSHPYLHNIPQGVGEGGLNDSRCWTETCRIVDLFLNLLEAWQYPGEREEERRERERNQHVQT